MLIHHEFIFGGAARMHPGMHQHGAVFGQPAFIAAQRMGDQFGHRQVGVHRIDRVHTRASEGDLCGDRGQGAAPAGCLWAFPWAATFTPEYPRPQATDKKDWINDNWAWKLFGARSYDDLTAGTFTAYIEVGDPAGDGFDCSVDRCGLFTRNDHTALSDRVQDLYIPVAFG